MNETISEITNRLRLYFSQLKSTGNGYFLPLTLHEPQELNDDIYPSVCQELENICAESDASCGNETSAEKKQEMLDKLCAEIKDHPNKCVKCCQLVSNRKNIVFGAGNPNAVLMFVGEAPGRDEDIQGIPFVGKAGQLLTKIIESIGLKREQVYIANVLKCRPPDNRNPLPDEIENCAQFLVRQIEIIQPKVICALGAFAAKTLLETDKNISSLRGKQIEYKGRVLVPTYHPSFLLRSPNMKKEVWKDMLEVKKLLQA